MPNRRTFLKSSGIAAAATALPSLLAEQQQAAAPAAAASAASNPVDLVELLQGTSSTPVFSEGNTLPIAATPFGMAHWTPVTSDRTPWMFQPWTRRLQGFRCTHQLSPWLSDYGYATFMPVSGTVKPEPGPRSSSYRPQDLKLKPYSLEFFLLRYRARVELVPTERCCVMATAYDAPPAPPAHTGQQPQQPGFVIDVPSVRGEIEQTSPTRLQFACDKTSGGTPENFETYYVVEFSEAWQSRNVERHKNEKGNDRQILLLQFAGPAGFEARIGTSFISFEQAAHNLRHEVGSTPIASLRQQTAGQWNHYLQRIGIEGATPVEQQTFYSCMYRALLFPRTFHEPVPDGPGMRHYSAFNGKVEAGVMYADHGYWDVYRAWYPLASLLFPEKLGEILQAWVNALNEGGWFPQFPAPGYRACMSGSLIDSLFADAIAKDIGSFDREVVFAGLKKHATQPGDPDKGYGRVGVAEYMRLHYVPADKIEQSVAETADAAYGDFCIAQIAQRLGKQQDYTAFMLRSEYWKNIYDTQTGFFRGKNSDGTWLTPFDTFVWGSPYEEGCAWQHRWNAPHAVAGLVAASGGGTAAVQALQQMLATPPVFHVGVYGEEIHEMSEVAAIDFGQYAHSNQPSHHLLYLFAHAGRPDLTQFWVRRVMQELYSPQSFAGDEDTGSMAAWYVLSALGLYQVCPGVPQYTLGSPLFRRATVSLENGKTLVIEAPDNSGQNVYAAGVRWKGTPQAGPTIAHNELMGGGTLTFHMKSKAGA